MLKVWRHERVRWVVRRFHHGPEDHLGVHDMYGKSVLRIAAGSAFQEYGPAVFTPYGDRGGATIDGVLGTSIAVEIESRVSKQVRGALLDLICHPFPKKLLVLLPVHMDASLCAAQCMHILDRFIEKQSYRVVVLCGSGHAAAVQTDVARVKQAVADLDPTLASYAQARVTSQDGLNGT